MSHYENIHNSNNPLN